MDSSAGHNTPTVKGVNRPSFLADSSLTRLYFALLIPALRLRLGSQKESHNHFKPTVICHT